MMRTTRRQQERYPCLKPMALVLKNGLNGPRIAGPSRGAFCNISEAGACLVVGEVDFGRYHMVRTPQEDDSKILELEVDGMAILCHPVWFHKFIEDGDELYRIGIRFAQEGAKEAILQ